MATIIQCDRCKKQQNKQEGGWGRLTLNNIENVKGLNKWWNPFVFCPECTKIIFTKIVKILNKK